MDNINTPEELIDFMYENFNYGFLGKSGQVYHFDDDNFQDNWINEYILQTPDELLINKYGNCYDEVEFERNWFLNHGYEVKTIFEMVLLDYKNDYSTHSYLVYKDKDNKWCLFENADYDRRGIYKFDTYEDVIHYQYNEYLKDLKALGIKDDEVKRIIIRDFDKPKAHISSSEYIDHVIDSRVIDFE
jgi:hypothetical protein